MMDTIDSRLLPGMVPVAHWPVRPPRNRRRTDVGADPGGHVGPIRRGGVVGVFPVVVQRAGGPVHDWATDPEWRLS